MQYDRFRSWLPSLPLVLLPVALYATSLGNDFVIWDDNSLVYKNPIVKHFSLFTLRAIFTRYDPELYIPLTFFTYQVEHLLFGLNPTAYHVTNLALHCANTVMIFLLLQRWKIERRVAWIAALIFSIHPMNSEAVLWVSARKDTLSSFFFLATLLQWGRYCDRRSSRSYWSACILFLLGLLSKVSIALLPMLLLAHDWYTGRRVTRATLKEKIPFALLSLLFIIIALLGKTRNISSVTPWETLLLSGKAIAFSLMTFFWPFRLSSIYHQSSPIGLLEPDFLVSIGTLLVLGILTLLSLKRTREVAFAALFFLLLVLPSFANFAKPGGIYFASDRYIYMAQIGILLLLTKGWMWISKQKDPLWVSGFGFRMFSMVFLMILLPAYVHASYERGKLWGDSEMLFRDAMEKNPGNAIIRFNLAVVRQTRGDLVDATALYEETLRTRPKYSEAHNNLGVIAQDLGSIAEAERRFREAVSIDAHNVSALTNLGALLNDTGRSNEALSILLQATAKDAYNPFAWSNLGVAYGKQERYAEGLDAFRRAWALDPTMEHDVKKLESLLQRASP